MRFIGITSKRMIGTRSLRTVFPACFVIVDDAGQRREARNLSARIDSAGRSGVAVVNKNAADHRQGSGIKHSRMKKITVVIELPVGRDLSLLAYARH